MTTDEHLPSGITDERQDLRAVREAELASLEVPSLTPRAQQIVEVALELLEEAGPEGVSMRLVAARLGVRAPRCTSTCRTSRRWRTR